MKTLDRVCRLIITAALVLTVCISPAFARDAEQDRFGTTLQTASGNSSSVIDSRCKSLPLNQYSYGKCINKAPLNIPPYEVIARICQSKEKLNDTSKPEAQIPCSISDDKESYQNVPLAPKDEAGSIEPDIIEEAGTTDHNNEPASTEDTFAAEVIRLVNAERTAAGLSPLRESSLLEQAAYVRCGEIMTVFSHTRPDGSSCFTALQKTGAVYSRAGENIAIGQSSPAQVVQAWMNSPGHRANIMNGEFHYIGVSARPAGAGYGGYAWVQVFTD